MAFRRMLPQLARPNPIVANESLVKKTECQGSSFESVVNETYLGFASTSHTAQRIAPYSAKAVMTTFASVCDRARQSISVSRPFQFSAEI